LFYELQLEVGVYLHKLYLMPHFTGQKYGAQMFDYIEKLSREKKQKWLWLEVLEQNKSARKFYEKKNMRWYRNILFTSPKQQSILHIMVKSINYGRINSVCHAETE
jgi:ribosomal protein S18 acetylase RimI-like enzyme